MFRACFKALESFMQMNLACFALQRAWWGQRGWRQHQSQRHIDSVSRTVPADESISTMATEGQEPLLVTSVHTLWPSSSSSFMNGSFNGSQVTFDVHTQWRRHGAGRCKWLAGTSLYRENVWAEAWLIFWMCQSLNEQRWVSCLCQTCE